MTRTTTNRVVGPDQGIFLATPKDAIPARGWSDLYNVRCDSGVIRTSPGWTRFGDTSLDGPIKRLDQLFLLDGTDHLIAITNAKVWRWDIATEAWIDITGATPLTGAIDDLVDSDTAFDLFVFTDNFSRVRKWTGTGNQAVLGGLTSCEDGLGTGTIDCQAAKSLTSFAGFLHLANTIENGDRKAQRWRWSRFENAEGWDNIATYGQAGFADLTDGPDKLQKVKRLGGDFLALYKEKSIHIAQYVGPPTVWARRLAAPGVGLLSPGAVADLGSEHVFVGTENIYLFNGLSLKPIGHQVFNTFINELNPSAVHMMWSHVIHEENEIIFAYPSGGNTTPNKAMVYNYFNDSWTFRDMPFITMGYYRRTDSVDPWDDDTDTWDSDTSRWDDTHYSENAPLHLGGNEDGDVFSYGDGYDQNGADHTSFAISPALDASKPELIKRLFKILVDLEDTGTHNLEIWYTFVNNKNAALTWSRRRLLPCDLSTKPYVTMDAAGRWLFIRFRTSGVNKPWALSAYGAEFILRGRY